MSVNAYHWHPWFAWHPVFVRVSETEVTMVWFEKIERRRVGGYGGNYWEYRPVG